MTKFVKLIDSDDFEFIVNIESIVLIHEGWGRVHIKGIPVKNIKLESMKKLIEIIGLDIHD